jgi:hypothetical protein
MEPAQNSKKKERWNMRGKAWRSRIGRVFLAGLAMAVLLGCDSLTSSKLPSEARLMLSDQSGTLPVEISTSRNFLVTEGGNISFEEFIVDTVSIPFDQTYNIEDHLRFYVMATNVQDETQSFRMKVTIGENNKYNEIKTLAPGETAQFIYRYQDPRVF